VIVIAEEPEMLRVLPPVAVRAVKVLAAPYDTKLTVSIPASTVSVPAVIPDILTVTLSALPVTAVFV
jgi:hypothetical protein